MGSSKGAHPAFNWRSTHTLWCIQQLGEILVQQQGRSEAAGPAACGGNRREVQQRPTRIQGETRLGERGQQHTSHTWCIQCDPLNTSSNNKGDNFTEATSLPYERLPVTLPPNSASVSARLLLPFPVRPNHTISILYFALLCVCVFVSLSARLW
ncbi:hypothetical protein LR48_Vigan07g127400 [Vigna angularis]|uniref:Uncharacterized protein n=1 Tax=Phaseolus angularis TaxID=3914 RepID=A0A0L9UXJ6_PHAAN|nr:hypothetical protein LR48_Vigan07g127400 [Vigna angularis]